MRSKDRKKLEKKLDTIWSKKVRSIGYCEVCGKDIFHDVLHAHHIFSRKHMSTRWNVKNGLSLCYRHHLHYFHKDVREANLWLETYKTKEFLDELRLLAFTPAHQTEDDLQIIKKELES